MRRHGWGRVAERAAWAGVLILLLAPGIALVGLVRATMEAALLLPFAVLAAPWAAGVGLVLAAGAGLVLLWNWGPREGARAAVEEGAAPDVVDAPRDARFACVCAEKDGCRDAYDRRRRCAGCGALCCRQHYRLVRGRVRCYWCAYRRVLRPVRAAGACGLAAGALPGAAALAPGWAGLGALAGGAALAAAAFAAAFPRAFPRRGGPEEPYPLHDTTVVALVLDVGAGGALLAGAVAGAVAAARALLGPAGLDVTWLPLR
jgi:hypothetical protein